MPTRPFSCWSTYHTSLYCSHTRHTDEQLLHNEGGVHRCVLPSRVCISQSRCSSRVIPTCLLCHKATAICSCTYNHLLALSARIVDHYLKTHWRTSNPLRFFEASRVDTHTLSLWILSCVCRASFLCYFLLQEILCFSLLIKLLVHSTWLNIL